MPLDRHSFAASLGPAEMHESHNQPAKYAGGLPIAFFAVRLTPVTRVSCSSRRQVGSLEQGHRTQALCGG